MKETDWRQAELVGRDHSKFVWVYFLGDDALFLKNYDDLLVVPREILDRGELEFMWSMKRDEAQRYVDLAQLNNDGYTLRPIPETW